MPLTLISNALVILIGVLHLYFLVLEMFLWDKPPGLRAFGHTRDAARSSKVLAANQGLYNGFLAAGLFWSAFAADSAFSLKCFFLSCVLIAGVYGSLTASRKILFIQAVPAAVALLLSWLAVA